MNKDTPQSCGVTRTFKIIDIIINSIIIINHMIVVIIVIISSTCEMHCFLSLDAASPLPHLIF